LPWPAQNILADSVFHQTISSAVVGKQLDPEGTPQSNGFPKTRLQLLVEYPSQRLLEDRIAIERLELQMIKDVTWMQGSRLARGFNPDSLTPLAASGGAWHTLS
jgi:hypothetical protein